MIGKYENKASPSPMNSNRLRSVLKVLKAKDVNVVEAFGQLVPLIVLTGGATVWAALSPNNVAETMPHQFFLTIGFMFSFITVN